MPVLTNRDRFHFLGTLDDDIIKGAPESPTGDIPETSSDVVIWVNGRQGDDDITTGRGNDLAAGDMLGTEWRLVDGAWTYDRNAVTVSSYGRDWSFDDVITTGAGNDVLLGNGGNDVLNAGAGHDIVNAGTGNDRVFAGTGNDTVNLEHGHDYVEAGRGADIVNGGAGNDVIYGDLAGENLLTQSDPKASTFAALAQGAGWTMTDDRESTIISQTAATIAGQTYTISFQLAANLAGQHSAAAVDVIWNGEVIDTVQTTSGGFETFKIDVVSTGQEGELAFRAIDSTGGPTYNFDGPITSYEAKYTVGGADVTVNAFAPGQAGLYQVINGHLNVFDVATETYTAVGSAPGFNINAVGFNVEDDLIYGVAKSKGLDSLGNAVDVSDIVMIDASGDTFRIGAGFYGDYVGDFDSDGNLWTFHSALNRISVVDVDMLDADGNPMINHFHFPSNMFNERTYDIAYNAAQDCFLAVIAPRHNGGTGTVVRIDTGDVANGGTPTITELEITGTLHGDTMLDGMPRGAYGAVFFDGDGNLYFGLNNGDHDLDQATGAQGGIYRVAMDWDAGDAYAEFMAEAPATGSNDGAVDPRSMDAFAEINADAAVLLSTPTLTLVEGGNDTLRGGEGDDVIYGNDGADDINGGAGQDRISGDQGDDLISAGSGDDAVMGGAGNDRLRGESGDDRVTGGDGNDYLSGGSGADDLAGGVGRDRIVGGTGEDVIQGGQGNDQLWGGNWVADDSADTFVFEQSSGRDFVHDFEVQHDVIDLSAFDTDWGSLLQSTQDQGWATIIDLSAFDTGQQGDEIVLLAVDLADLETSNFLF